MTNPAPAPPPRAAVAARTRSLPDLADLAAAGAIAIGVAYRLLLILAQVPRTNSDEAILGLVGWHVAQGGPVPPFIYGQNYMGTIEGLLAAPLFALAGPSVLLLRLPMLAAYAVLAVTVYRLTRRLYSPWFAAFIAVLLALGSDRVVKDQLIANGFAWVVPLSAVLLLGALSVRRSAGFIGWGMAAGLAMWTDWLVVPYLAAAALLLAGRVGRRLCGRAGLAVLAGFVAGDAPQLIHDLRVGYEQSSVHTYLTLALSGQPGPPLGARLSGGLLTGVPMRLGLCAPNSCGHPAQVSGILIVGLLGISAAAAVPGLRRGDPRAAGRLALAAAGLASIALYTRSPAAGATPTESVRYLACLVVSTPAVLGPLWTIAATRRRWPAVAATGALAIVLTLSVVSTALVASTVPGHRQAAANQRLLIGELDRLGVRHFYTDYWTCTRLAFATRERLTCATIDAHLHPDQDKVPGYRAIVDADPTPAYVLLAGTPADRAIAGYAPMDTTVAGYHIYLPHKRIPVPQRVGSGRASGGPGRREHTSGVDG